MNAGNLETKRFRISLAFVLLLTAAVFAIRMTAPPNIMDNDQERPASYILDVLENGHWIVQTDWMGDITSKPPMYTWTSALVSLPFGELNRFTLYLPCALSTAILVVLVFMLGQRYAGVYAGLAGSVLYLGNHLVTKQMALARTDPMFSLFVALGAFVAFSNWRCSSTRHALLPHGGQAATKSCEICGLKGRNWIIFWIIAAAATLTKGPFGLILSASGLLAALWEKKDGAPAAVRGSHWQGVAVYFLVGLGWLLLAYMDMGQPVIDKLIGKELVSQAVSVEDAKPLYARLWRPSFYFITRFFPGSILAIGGIVQIVRRPSTGEDSRKLERFLLCWLLAGIAILSVAQHQRGDLLMPLLPPAAVIGGAWLARLTQERRSRFYTVIAVFTAAYLALLAGHEYYFKRNHMKEIRRSIGMKEAASFIRSRKPEEVPLYYVDAPYAIQYYLNTMKHSISLDHGVQLLSRKEPVWVAVINREGILKRLKEPGKVKAVFEWPGDNEPYVTIFSNRAMAAEQGYR